MRAVNDLNFESEMTLHPLILVDCSAEWCGPCKKQIPILEKFAENNSDVRVVTLDIDDSPKTSGKLGILSVPSLVLFKNGQMMENRIGLTSLNELQRLVDKYK